MSLASAEGLVRLGERANPKRSFLLVSTVLGKHVPLPVARCRAAGAALGLLVAGDPRADAARDAVLSGDLERCAAVLGDLAARPAAAPRRDPVAADGAAGDPAARPAAAPRRDPAAADGAAGDPAARPAGGAGDSAARPAGGAGDSAARPAGGAGDSAARPAGAAGAAVRGADWTVVGFAETATGLTHQVGEALDCAWLQTTTRHPDAAARGLAFEESHSHAPDQWLLPLPDGLPDGPLVLVDDELSTGATCANLIRVLHARRARSSYVIAALLDARPDGPGPLDALAAELRVAIDVVALARHPRVDAPPPGWSGGALPSVAASPVTTTGDAAEVEVPAPPRTEREGLDRPARAAFRLAAERAAEAVGPLPDGALVLGCGEHLALPQLAALANDPATLTSSTTRSPALVTDAEGYPLRDGLSFAHPEAPGLPGYAYNVRAAQRPAIVVHFAEPAHRAAAGELLAALAGAGSLTTVTLT